MLAVIPVSRSRAVLRALPRLLAAGAAVVLIGSVRGRLRFTPTGASNRITDYAWALALLPVVLAVLWLAVAGLRWLLLAVWPRRVAFCGRRRDLTLDLGPFGHHRLDVARMSIQYPHELDPDDGGDPFETFEDPEVQERTRLPHMEHPDYPGRLDWLLLRLAGGEEQAVVRQLSPFVKAVREADSMGEANQS
ncbi:MAG: hypothetical protein GY778_24055 [bacterium]|nr:hypothetical protein [bacterium]